MKNRNIIIVMSLLIVLAWACESALGGTIIPGEYYTWGISNNVLSDSIPDGSIITEAELTIHNVTNITDNENDALYIHLLDNPPVGFTSNLDNGSGDFFENEGILLAPVYRDQATGTEDRVYTLGNLDDASSRVWDIFGNNFTFDTDFSSVLYSASVLELIDYAGNGTPFGFGFDPNGSDSYNFDQITLELTIESFEGTYVQSPLTFFTKGIPGLVGHWEFDDNSASTTVVDSSVNGNNGTAQQNTEDLSSTGIIDDALIFNGSSDYVDCGNDSSLQITGNLSISAWVRTSSGLRQFIVSKDDLINRSYSLFMMDGMIRFQIFENDTYYRIFSATTINDGSWHHVVGINDGTDLKVYIDGELETLPGAGGAIDNESADLWIGARNDLTKYFNGSIDDVRIFDKALSQAEIGTLYNEGTAIVNHHPLIATIGDKSIEENQTLSFTVSASDPDGDNLTYSASNLHVGASLDSQTGLFNWTPSDGDAGQYLVTFTVTDDGEGNLTNSETITITVTSSSGMPTPVANWTMDDNSASTTVLDSSSNENHGTARQNTEYISTTGVIDDALTFNGTSDYIDCGNNSSLQITGNLSISAWVRTSSGLRQFIVSKDDLVNRSYSLFMMDGMIRFQIFENDTYYRIFSATTINDGSWHHVVGINDGTDLKVYIDGELETLPGAGGIIDNKSADLWIGARSDLTRHFNGSIDDVRLFNSALSASEIATLYDEATVVDSGIVPDVTGQSQSNAESAIAAATFTVGTVTSDYSDTVALGNVISQNPTAGTSTASGTSIDLVVSLGPLPSITPVAHWALDDNEPDTTVADSSFNGNNGTAQQNTEDISTTGIIDDALIFNGSSDYVDCGNNSSLQITDNLSISAWVRTTSGLRQFIVCKDDLINRSYSLFMVDGMIRFQIFENDTYDRISSTTSINDGSWHHVVGINDGTDLKVYIDGELETLPGAGGIIDNKSADLWIGARSDLTRHFNGSIDDVRIFDKALSGDEVTDLYNNEGGG